MRLLFVSLCLLVPAFSQDDPFFGFEANTGQFPPAVRFARRNAGNFYYFTRDAVVLRNGIRIQIADLDPSAIPEGDSPTSTVYNFYQGNDPSAWRANVHLFAGMRIASVSPGVSAVFGASKLSLPNSTTISFDLIKLVLTLQPGADLSKFRLRVLNTGAIPFVGPDHSIWYSGANFPGVFEVGVQTTQGSNSIASNLKIESSESLSVQIPDGNPGLPTKVEITFPSSEFTAAVVPPAVAADGNRYLASSAELRADFGEDGTLSHPACGPACIDAVAVRLDATGKPVWVTLFGGAKQELISFIAPSTGGVAISGTTASGDFPLTANAPASKLNSPQDAFLAFLDRDSGQLRNSTYAGVEGSTSVQQQAVDAGGDVAIGGGYGATSVLLDRGYLLRWQPATNRFVFSVRFTSPVASLAFDSDSNLYFALSKYPAPDSRLQVGLLDVAGRQQGNFVNLSIASADFVFSDVRLLPAPNREVWAIYQLKPTQPSGEPRLSAARLSTALGQIVFDRSIASVGTLADAAIAPSGNLKLLIYAGSTAATSADAALVAGCPDSYNYFAILSPAGQLVYASYVPSSGFDFAAQNQPPVPSPAKVSCIASTAGRMLLYGSVAPGELITLTGGGFGPATPIYGAPDKLGMYPRTLGGFRVRVAGQDAPIIAVARGLIAVQVSFDLVIPQFSPVISLIEVFDNGTPLNTLPIYYTTDVSLGYFDTGDRDNALNLPALAALNQDGTVNSKNNPAINGSIVSLFGSGLGRLSPPLVTGGLNPAEPLSQGPALPLCLGCREILYIGSAPGLSTSVFQINVRLSLDESSAGVHVHPFGPAKDLPPSGVVFVK